MLSLCNGSGKALVKDSDNVDKYSTLSPTSSYQKNMNPQIIQRLHNFSTQFSTAKNDFLTDARGLLSTLSTDTITTTTIIYKER